jgi:hypothetical protein
MKIRLFENEKHRNETTFRPLLIAQDLFRQVGINFTTENNCDLTLVAQASIADKKEGLDDSINKGLDTLSRIGGEYIIIDGQDSTSLMGTYEVFKNSSALFFLKNSLLKDRGLYKKGWKLGRYYWGKGDYSLKDFDKYSDKIFLSGCNWLSVTQPQWQPSPPKEYDVSALFQYPQAKEGFEHGSLQHIHYNNHRKTCISEIEKLSCNVVKLDKGKKLPQEEYYKKMFSSKIIIAPFGYGEMAPRDIESAIYGSILVKPDMSYIDSEPFIYEDGKTYIACKHDYSDLREKIDYILSNYETLQPYFVDNMRKSFNINYHPINLVKYIYNLFLKQNII